MPDRLATRTALSSRHAGRVRTSASSTGTSTFLPSLAMSSPRRETTAGQPPRRPATGPAGGGAATRTATGLVDRGCFCSSDGARGPPPPGSSRSGGWWGRGGGQGGGGSRGWDLGRAGLGGVTFDLRPATKRPWTLPSPCNHTQVVPKSFPFFLFTTQWTTPT